MDDERIPAGGRRKPPSKVQMPPRPKSWYASSWPEITPMTDGRYRLTYWTRNRCEQKVQVGATQVCVVGDYGFLVVVDSWTDWSNWT